MAQYGTGGGGGGGGCGLTLLFLASSLVSGRHVDDAVGVNVKCNFDLWDTSRGGRDTDLQHSHGYSESQSHTQARPHADTHRDTRAHMHTHADRPGSEITISPRERKPQMVTLALLYTIPSLQPYHKWRLSIHYYVTAVYTHDNGVDLKW